MKLITKDTDYALRALCYIAKNKNELVSVSELVIKLKIPKPFLRKILQILNKEGILNSYKGQGGGFKLAHSPNKILLVDLIEIFQGKLKLNECIFRGLKCPETTTCVFKRKIDVVEKHVIKEIKTITLLSLLEKEAELYEKKEDYRDRRSEMYRLWPVYPNLS